MFGRFDAPNSHPQPSSASEPHPGSDGHSLQGSEQVSKLGVQCIMANVRDYLMLQRESGVPVHSVLLQLTGCKKLGRVHINRSKAAQSLQGSKQVGVVRLI